MCVENVLSEYCELLEEGSWGKIWSITADFLKQVCPQATTVEELVDEMAENKAEDFAAVVSHLASNGEHRSHKFRDEANGFKAIAIKGKQKQYYRFPCFRVGNHWVIVYGFIKPRKKLWDVKHNEWATKVRDEIQTKIRSPNEQAERKT